MPPRGSARRTSPAPAGNARGASNTGTAVARGSNVGRGNATGLGRGRGDTNTTGNARTRGTTTVRRPDSRARGVSTARGRGNVQWRAGSPDLGSALPAAQGFIGVRDPTKTSDKSAYMKHMSDLFQKLRDDREQERRAAIRDGALADPDKKTTLAEAITPVGICQDMCPEFERVERIVQHAVDKCERKSLDNGNNKVVWEPYMVKRFRRSAAGTDDQIPSDIRPPLVLKKTLDYLLNSVVGGPEPLGNVHKFVWDRTRAIRNDFSIQQVSKVEDLQIAIECFERIARFHLLSLHQLSRPSQDSGDFDAHQEREQLGNTLLSLMYYYDDSRKKFMSPNEAEFRAYGIIFEIQDRRPDLEYRVQTWPKRLLQDPRVQAALRLHAAASNIDDEQGPLNPRCTFAIAQGNFGRFWSVVKSPSISYLAACAAEVYFNFVRSTALGTIYKSYRRPSPTVDDLTLDILSTWLGFDTEDQTQKFCEDHGFTVKEQESGVAYVDLSSVSTRWLNDTNTGRGQIFSRRLVEAKRHGRTLPAVIKGYNVARCKAEGLIETMLDASHDDSLFLSEDDKDHTMQAKFSPQLSDNSTLTAPANPFQRASSPNSQTNQVAMPNPFASATPKPSPFGGTSIFQTGHSSMSSAANPFSKATSLSSSQLNSATQGGLFKSTSQPSRGTNVPSTGSTELGKSSTATTALTNEKAKPFGFPSTEASTQEALSSTNANKSAQLGRPDSLRPSGPALLPMEDQQKHDVPPQSLFQFPAKLTSTSQGQTQGPIAGASGTEKLFPTAQTAASTSFPGPVEPQSEKTPMSSIFSSAAPVSTSGSGLSLAALDHQKKQEDQQRLEQEKLRQQEQARLRREQEAEQARKRHEEQLRRQQEEERIRRAREEEQRAQEQRAQEQRAQERREQQLAQAKADAFDSLAYHYTIGPGGLIDMFLEALLGPIVSKSMDKVKREQEKARVASARAFLLGSKYFRVWRQITYDRILKRSAQARRQRMAEARLEARRSIRSSRANSASSSELEPPRGLVHPDLTLSSPPTGHSSGLLRSSMTRRSLSRVFEPSDRVSERSAQTGRSDAASQFKRMKIGHSRSSTVDAPVRFSRSEDKRLSLQHRSRDRLAHSQVLTNDALLKKARRLVTGRTDTTQTDYFRLKAMGLSPDTPAVPETRKRPRTSDVMEDSTRKASRSSPPPPAAIQRWSRSVSRITPEATLKNSPPRVPSFGNDGDLFAKVREVRQAMADSEAWYKSAREDYESKVRSASAAHRHGADHPHSVKSTPSRTSVRHQMSGSHGYLERFEEIKQRRAAEAAAEAEAARRADEPETIDFDDEPPANNSAVKRPLAQSGVNGAASETQLHPPPLFQERVSPVGSGTGASMEDAIEL